MNRFSAIKTRRHCGVFRKPLRLVSVTHCPLLVLSSSGCANFVITGGSSTVSPPSGPPPSPMQGGTVTLTPQYVALAPGQSFKFVATASKGGAISWSAKDAAGGSSDAGTIDGSGTYTVPAALTQSANFVVTASLASSPQSDYASAVVSVIHPGQIRCPPSTGNPHVAQYSLYLPAGGNVSVQFGTNTNYGLDTWSVPTSSADGGQVNLWVAGMLGQTLYHIAGAG